MDSISTIIARGKTLISVRDDSSSTSLSPSIMSLLIALIVLMLVSILLVGLLFVVRRMRRGRAIARQQLPLHNVPGTNPRRLTIMTTPNGYGSSICVYGEKSSMISNSSTTSLSTDSVPEIRITFPDEQDESGRRKSGRVVVVRVGETSVGLEPLEEEQLPAYQKESGGRFHSIDMERIGGLKEKSTWS